jgi:hypothetical protein
MAYNSLYEWQEIEALELGNKKIDELRKEINNINIQMIKFSLLGETILEWNDKDIEHYHARRMAMDSMLCRFKATYPAERIDSVRSLLEDKERQMFQIVRLMDEQQSINKKIANQIPVIVQKSVQEQSKKPKRKGFLGIFGKKKEVTPAVSTTILHSVNRNVISEQKVQDRQLSEQADSLAARNAELNRQLQELICQIEEKVQTELQSRENEIVAMREKSFMQVGGLMGFVLLLLLISYIIIHRDAKSIKQYKHKTISLMMPQRMPNTPKAVRIIKPHIANPMCCAICLKFAVAVISSLFLIFLFLMRIQELRELSFKLSYLPLVYPTFFLCVFLSHRSFSFRVLEKVGIRECKVFRSKYYPQGWRFLPKTGGLTLLSRPIPELPLRPERK